MNIPCLLMVTLFAATASLASPPETALTAVPGGKAGRLIRHFGMQRVPAEGVWFSVSYVSEDRIDGAALPARYAQRPHLAGSAIYVVATPADFSALHRLQTDETWHFYGGSPLRMVLLHPDGRVQRITLGSDVLAGQLAQLTVPRGVWQGAAPQDPAAGAYSFAGTQLSPGFEYSDFEIGYRDELAHDYPQAAADIRRLTRADYVQRPAADTRAVSASPPAGAVFTVKDKAAVALPGGITLRELVGRAAGDARSSALSVAAFTLPPGTGTGRSRNRVSQEVFLVTLGSGQVSLGAMTQPVSAGSVVFIPEGLAHSITADAASTLEFHAIESPAWSPDDSSDAEP